MNTLSTKQAARFLGIPVEVLIRMRTDGTRAAYRKGPPYCKVLTSAGETRFVYKKRDLARWEKMRCMFLTLGDVAILFDLPPSDIRRMTGLQHHDVGTGRIIMDVNKNFFRFIRKKRRKR